MDKESEREKEVAAEEESADRKKYDMAEVEEDEDGATPGAPKKTDKPTATRPRKNTAPKKK